MPSLEPAVRRLAVQARRAGLGVKEIVKVLGVCRNFVWEWCARANHPGSELFKDRSKAPMNPERKVTEDVESAILALRTAFDWGTARIRVALSSTPPYLTGFLSQFGYRRASTNLSRTTVNKVLAKHGKNGSPYGELHEWRFKHAEKPNELWQLDLKGPIIAQGERKFVLVVVDDYSRYDVVLHVFHKDPTAQEILQVVKQAFQECGKPQRILTDNGGQFKEAWKNDLWNDYRIEAVFAHPYYPQDKGKVEREIRNVAEELIKVAKVLAQPIETLIHQYQEWRNNKRYHYGIKGISALLYVANVG